MKVYNFAPLPFMGQKRNFIHLFRKELEDFADIEIFVDLFGGSGLLSHNVKARYPKARVIFNDFDYYTHRLYNIDNTNKLIQQINSEIKGKFEKSKRLDEAVERKIKNIIKNQTGYVDTLTLSANILFAMNYAKTVEELCSYHFYGVPKAQYNADGYLKDVEIRHQDYKDLFKEFENTEKVCFICDPPYLSTEIGGYSKKAFWTLKKHLDVVEMLNDVENFFYFTSNKSNIIEFVQWLGTKTIDCNMAKAKVVKREEPKYIDYMLVYKKEKCREIQELFK